MNKNKPIAVVGMAGLFPGAGDLDVFWQNITHRVDATAVVGPDRWFVDPDSMYRQNPQPDKAYSKRCCLLPDLEFNPAAFGIDKNLVSALDPLYHIVLHVGREALSRIPKASLNRRRTGVILAAIALPTDATSSITRKILGSAFEEKFSALLAHEKLGADFKTSTLSQYWASRVTGLPGAILAKAFNLGGGTYTLDAACASSLYAIKLACDELHAHRTDAMLAGGVSRPNCLFTQVGFSQLKALSPSGTCAPFDHSADGLVVGEGAAILVLKRLADALQDHDTIYGLIHGVGLSNDLRGNLLAPDSEGQLRAMQRVYKSSGWSPHDIDLIECHGAGTPLGDLTELHSLTKLWGDSGWTKGQCAIGSVKSMVGHLLTAAGAAGMIKTLLAMHHKILPPSLNFKKPPEHSPLHDGPFRVQTQPEPWPRKKENCLRRAAVNAFGFGGINAHLLLEEWDSNLEDARRRSESAAQKIALRDSTTPHPEARIPKPDVAIIGMDTILGSITSLPGFQELVFKGATTIQKRPGQRWKGCDHVADKFLDNQPLNGGFLDEFSIAAGEFHIPPNEIPDILPQQLLMLKAAAKALKNAAMPLRENRPFMGAVIGIDFDFEATNFHLRWYLEKLIPYWIEKFGWKFDDDHIKSWLESLKDVCSPPLTATRTMGALGSIVASRIAREFRLGGPSFAVSCQEASGLKALEIGLRALQQNEAEAFLVGAVDLTGDIRNIVLTNQVRQYSKTQQIRAFDRKADGTLPGEGAAALVIKRLNLAIADGDRIYAVIKGSGSASGGGIDSTTPSKEAYLRSLKRCCQDAAIAPSRISFLETHGSGIPAEDNLEAAALHEFFANHNSPCAIGSLKTNIGHTGAAAGLASVIKTSLCLYHEIIPPLTNFTTPGNSLWQNEIFHVPAYPQYWLRDRQDGARTAMVGSMTPDGNCSHIILESYDYQTADDIPQETIQNVHLERKRPLGFQPYGLFVVEGENKQALLSGLETLHQHVAKHVTKPSGIRRCPNRSGIEESARAWYLANGVHPEREYAVTITADDFAKLRYLIAEAKEAVSSVTPLKMGNTDGIIYSPNPLGHQGQLAFVFPGSGNHYLGMGRDIGLHWPDILRQMDTQTLLLRSQLLPNCFVPWRISWDPGWQNAAYEKILSNPLNMIFGQVAHGGVVANLIGYFNISPSAVIGYSLGESTGYFAMGVWPERTAMLQRMQQTDLFVTELAGPCNAARMQWNVAPDEDVNWRVAVVNRSASKVRRIVDQYSTTRLLIVNTYDECVIGGRRHDVSSAIKELKCEAIYLDGVVTVHCDALLPVAEEYRHLHLFPTHPPKDIRFYSCAHGRKIDLTSKNAADSILTQALHGFDFPETVNRAYLDGVRIFLEIGPYSSCTRMITSILHDKPHLALSACTRGEDDYTTIVKVLAALIAERVPVDLEMLYGREAYAPFMIEPAAETLQDSVKIAIGTKMHLELGKGNAEFGIAKNRHQDPADISDPNVPNNQNHIEESQRPLTRGQSPQIMTPISELIESASQIAQNTAAAHQKFLAFSNELTQSYTEAIHLQAKLLQRTIQESGEFFISSETETPSTDVPPSTILSPASDIPHSMRSIDPTETKAQRPTSEPIYPREACLEFARGSAGRVLGAEFAVVDTYPARVRLPDEPLMLVDRILALEGQKGGLGPGRIITEHDVLQGAWYLDGGHAPVCISVEAGQADLFLCAYLGIDLAVKGQRTYRLLDASVKFHRTLPLPGETIRYEIEIEKFIRQGDTYLFLFHFNGFIGDIPLITMTNGCAGFFTEEEVKNSGGIILTEENAPPVAGKKSSNWRDLVAVKRASYDDIALQALRTGNLAACFGASFKGITIPESLRLPGGRMKLIDRIVNLDPHGGRFGLGLIQAEADIDPHAWYLTCHFVDDMVMPGTLMYECCAHTLRVFLQRLGWVTEKSGVYYEPVQGVESTLKCRGPVTPHTCKVIYEIEISEIGYRPEPYAIADAHMYADGHKIVNFKDMSLQMTGIVRDEIESFWKRNEVRAISRPTESKKTAIFERRHMLEFAEGQPSIAFGDRYKSFDEDRFIARLPRSPYLFIDRIVKAEPDPWIVTPGGWIEAEFDIDPNAWYFKADRNPAAPISILLEIALQPCGWLAAYMGSALRSQKDLRFRNLGGKATIHNEILPDAGTLTINTRLTNVSEAAEMIIEHFDFEVHDQKRKIYTGNTYFGFFTHEALVQQEGIRDAVKEVYPCAPENILPSVAHEFVDFAPLQPQDSISDHTTALALPAKAIRMIDRIETFIPHGGPKGLGFIRATKGVDPQDWFFKAHFYQDPVCPGSLGIESFIQLLKFIGYERWPHLRASHRFALLTAEPHIWTYRGQILPQNQLISVQATIKELQEDPTPVIKADGYLEVDGLYIYKMENFGIKLVPI